MDHLHDLQVPREGATIREIGTVDERREGPKVGEHITDAQAASMVRMLTRNQTDHEYICVLGRDRIMALSAERDALARQNLALREALETIDRELNTIAEGKYEEVKSDVSSGEAYGWGYAADHASKSVAAALKTSLPDAAKEVETWRKTMNDAASVIEKIWRRVPARGADTPLTRTVEFSDEQVGELYDTIAALRATKAGKK